MVKFKKIENKKVEEIRDSLIKRLNIIMFLIASVWIVTLVNIAKIFASVLFLIITCVILRYINGYTTFINSFSYGFLLWTIVNLYDVIVLDIIWFCHDKQFVFKGTEDIWIEIKEEIIYEE